MVQYTDSTLYELKQSLPDGRTGPDATLPDGAWVPTQRRCTDIDAHGFPATFDQRLRRFSLWTNRTLNLNDRVQIQPWWFGSNQGPVNLGASSHVMGNLRVGGDLTKRTLGNLYGEAWITGNYVSQTAGGIDSLVHKDSLTRLRIELPARIFAGGTWQFAQPGQTLDLLPGNYGGVTVNSRSTLVLHGGTYEFTQIYMEPGAVIRVQFRDSSQGTALPLQVHIENGIYSKQDVRFDLVGGDASDILWMIYGTAGLHVGSYPLWNPQVRNSAGFHGSVIAPKSKVEIASDGAFTGTIISDELEIHQGNQFVTFVPYDNDPTTRDSDGDGLADSTELRIGSDPNDLDTDEDGLSDALELLGRGIGADGSPAHRFGAERAMRVCRDAWATLKSYQKKPCHLVDGYIPSPSRMERLNPTRRDLQLRLFWEADSALRNLPDSLNTPKISSFTEVVDSFTMTSMAASFSNDSNYYAIPDSDLVRVPSLRIALHIDAGPGKGTVNYPEELERLGGERIVSGGGDDSWNGYWNYDIGGDIVGYPYYNGARSGVLDLIDGDSVVARMAKSLPYSVAFWDLFHYGFMAGRNILDGNGVSQGIPGDVFLTGTSASVAHGLALTIMHEFGHNLGLRHHSSTQAVAWLYDGLMNYKYPFNLGCTIDKWDPITGKGSVNDTRWCGEMPRKGGIVPAGHPRAGQEWYLACLGDSRVFLNDSTGNLAWKCSDQDSVRYYNREPMASDYFVRIGDGPLDLTTGYRKNYPLNGVSPASFMYSNGRICSVDLTALDEQQGLSICRERGLRVPPKSQGAIDFNGNGIIDTMPVDLYSDENVLKR